MPRRYPTGFRDEMVCGMLVGESVSDLVLISGQPTQTLHWWKHQELFDAGLAEGIDSAESAALRGAHMRIKAIGQELKFVKDSSEIYDSLGVRNPKGGWPSR